MQSILTHNGEITITNPATGGHRTLRIKTAQSGGLKGKRILSLLIGQDNENDYLGIGFVNDDNIQIWNKYKNSQYEKIAKCLLKIEEKGLIAQFSTVCRVCNRKLTDPISIKTGIGPTCSGRQ